MLPASRCYGPFGAGAQEGVEELDRRPLVDPLPAARIRDAFETHRLVGVGAGQELVEEVHRKRRHRPQRVGEGDRLLGHRAVRAIGVEWQAHDDPRGFLDPGMARDLGEVVIE